MTLPRISVCIATYKRADRLALLLQDLLTQTLLPVQVVVVDNDAGLSAQATVDQFNAQQPTRTATFELVYGTQLERNISLTRNLTVAMATGDWLAFIDDDERAPPNWLQQLYDSACANGADGVLGPVIPELPAQAPDWIRKGDFYSFPRLPSGAVVPLNQLRFGNVLLRGGPTRAEPGPFDPAFQLSTGEDADMLLRLIAKGAKVIWCDEACVTEPVEPARMSFEWLRQRAYSGGQEFARKALTGCYGHMGRLARAKFAAVACAKLGMALVMALLTLPFGRHHTAHWLIRAQANLGKLSAFSGVRYQEYSRV